MIAQYKAVGVKSGKVYFTGRHSECLGGTNGKARSGRDVFAHEEPIKIMLENEFLVEWEIFYIERLQREYRNAPIEKRAVYQKFEWTKDKEQFVVDRIDTEAYLIAGDFYEAFGLEVDVRAMEIKTRQLRKKYKLGIKQRSYRH